MKKKTGCRVRKYKAYRAMPWRNGRGVTLEIAREPAMGEEFAWRLSLADIDTDAEFSAYPGYRRALVLVAGNSLQLRFRGHGNRLLDPSSRGARFEAGPLPTLEASPAQPPTPGELHGRRRRPGERSVPRHRVISGLQESVRRKARQWLRAGATCH